MDKARADLAKYRLETARQCIISAKALIEISDYIKTRIFDVSMSDIISEAFDIRSDSDYNDYFVISKKEVEEQISNAQYFYDRVEEYVVAQIKDGGWSDILNIQ